MADANSGQPKIVDGWSLPLTAQRWVVPIVADMAATRPSVDGLLLVEGDPSVCEKDNRAATGAGMLAGGVVPTMTI